MLRRLLRSTHAAKVEGEHEPCYPIYMPLGRSPSLTGIAFRCVSALKANVSQITTYYWVKNGSQKPVKTWWNVSAVVVGTFRSDTNLHGSARGSSVTGVTTGGAVGTVIVNAANTTQTVDVVVDSGAAAGATALRLYDANRSLIKTWCAHAYSQTPGRSRSSSAASNTTRPLHGVDREGPIPNACHDAGDRLLPRTVHLALPPFGVQVLVATGFR
jgi:hypothetical protein